MRKFCEILIFFFCRVQNVAVKGPNCIINNLTPCIQVVLKYFEEKEENYDDDVVSDEWLRFLEAFNNVCCFFFPRETCVFFFFFSVSFIFVFWWLLHLCARKIVINLWIKKWFVLFFFKTKWSIILCVSLRKTCVFM